MAEKGQEKPRACHSSQLIGDSLYTWGGDCFGLPLVHNSETKRSITSVIEIFNVSSGQWSSQHTIGTPPLGVMGYSCCTVNNYDSRNIYYFGGYCGHDKCYHNSVTLFDTLRLEWTQLRMTDNSIMKRAHGSMISIGEEQLLAVGGLGLPPNTLHTQYQYKYLPSGRCRTNEMCLFDLSSRQWTIPSISGKCIPATEGFIMEKLSHNKGILFGGYANSGQTNSLYVFTLIHNTLHWESVKPVAVTMGNEIQWPWEMSNHASVIISCSSSPILAVLGGVNYMTKTVNYFWLLDTNSFLWTKVIHNWPIKIPLPEGIIDRYDHSLSVVVKGPHCVWLVAIGGYKKPKQKKDTNVFVSDSNLITVVIELIFKDDQWSVGVVLDSFNFPLLRKLIDNTAHLKQHIHFLQHELEVSQQNRQSLQEILLETKEQLNKLQENPTQLEKDSKKSAPQLVQPKEELIKCIDDSEPSIAVRRDSVSDEEIFLKEQFINESITEDNDEEKDETYIDQEQISFVDQKDTNYDIITELKAKVTEQDMQIAKLYKKNIKAVSSKSIQCDYWTRKELPFDDMVTVGKEVCLYNAHSERKLILDECGLEVILPEGLLSPVSVYEVATQGLWGGDFEFPKGTRLVSGVCYISISPDDLIKPVTVQLTHCVHIGDDSQTKYLSFVSAQSYRSPFKFKLLQNGVFSTDTQYGIIHMEGFSLIAIVMSVIGGLAAGIVATTIGMGDTTTEMTPNAQRPISIPNEKNTEDTFDYPPNCPCRAVVFCDNVTPEKMILTLAVTLDHKYIDKPFKNSSHVFGVEKYSFRFMFSQADDNCTDQSRMLKLNNFTPQNEDINGWTITSLTPPAISECHVYDYFESKCSQPPAIHISVHANPKGSANFQQNIKHALTIEGIDVIGEKAEIVIDTSLNELACGSMSISTRVCSLSGTTKDSQLLVKVFRKHFADMSNLMSIASNRLNIASRLYSQELISWHCYRDIVDTSSKTDQEKGTILMVAIMTTITNEPQLLTLLIDVLEKVKVFKPIANRIIEDINFPTE